MKTLRDLEQDVVASLLVATRGGERWPTDGEHILARLRELVARDPSARILVAIGDAVEAADRVRVEN